MEFSYVPRPFLGKDKTVVNIFRPEIPIRISYRHQLFPQEFLALLDSGSDYNLFPVQYGLIVGIPLSILIGPEKIKTFIDFCEYQEIPLLGRNDFFRFFDEIAFYESKQRIILR